MSEVSGVVRPETAPVSSGDSRASAADERAGNLAIRMCALLALAILLARSGWLADDAFISFRTVDNLVHGRGLTWNPGERVQGFTHPLWIFVMSAAYWTTSEMYYTPLGVCLALSVATVAVVLFGLARTTLALLFATIGLSASRAFMDYSSSGLENPLSHLLLVAFIAVRGQDPPSRRILGSLSLLVGLAGFNRLDSLLIYAPALAWLWWCQKQPRALGWLGWGFGIIALWELFSVVYFGFAFPNTAYAKLNTGIPDAELILQGVAYLMNSLGHDPTTLVLIGLGIAMSLTPSGRRVCSDWPVAAGLLLYLAYVVRIGGDFMTGRYLSVPLVGALALTVRRFPLDPVRGAFLLALLLWVQSQAGSLPLTGQAYYSDGRTRRDPKGITNEVAFYGPFTGLVVQTRSTTRSGFVPYHPWAGEGAQVRGKQGPVSRSNTGFFAYNAGPGVYIVDGFALTDPLLARLPAVHDPNWWIGHFERHVPEGYLETVLSEENRISDPKLATYYSMLREIVRGPIWSARRFGHIWRFATGDCDRLIDRDRYRYPGVVLVGLEAVSAVHAERSPSNAGGVVKMPASGVRIKLLGVEHASRLETSLDNEYEVRFLSGGQALGSCRAGPRPNGGGLTIHKITVPDEVVRAGWDEVWIVPTVGSEPYCLGHLRL